MFENLLQNAKLVLNKAHKQNTHNTAILTGIEMSYGRLIWYARKK